MGESYVYPYPRPMVTVDLVVFALEAEGLRSLFIQRDKPPFAGQWAIPGGYLEMDEPILAAARRELAEETGLKRVPRVDEIGVFGAPGRDPRGRTISIAHAAVIAGKPPQVSGGDDARNAAWLDPREVSDLAFDHAQILQLALTWLASGVKASDLALDFLPQTFDLNGMKRVTKATLASSRPASWIARRLELLGRIEKIKGMPGRYRRVNPK